MKPFSVRRLAFSAVCLALCMVLPFLTGQIPQFGKMLAPMHLPVLLCGFVCGFPWGLAVGLIAPLLRFALFGMPVLFPTGVGMMFELAAYGAFSGVFYRLLPKSFGGILTSLLLAMTAGRIVYGVVHFILAGLQGSTFPFSAFLAGAILNAWPGILVQIVLIPVLVTALRKTSLMKE